MKCKFSNCTPVEILICMKKYIILRRSISVEVPKLKINNSKIILFPIKSYSKSIFSFSAHLNNINTWAQY